MNEPSGKGKRQLSRLRAPPPPRPLKKDLINYAVGKKLGKKKGLEYDVASPSHAETAVALRRAPLPPQPSRSAKPQHFSR